MRLILPAPLLAVAPRPADASIRTSNTACPSLLFSLTSTPTSLSIETAPSPALKLSWPVEILCEHTAPRPDHRTVVKFRSGNSESISHGLVDLLFVELRPSRTSSITDFWIIVSSTCSEQALNSRTVRYWRTWIQSAHAGVWRVLSDLVANSAQSFGKFGEIAANIMFSWTSS